MQLKTKQRRYSGKDDHKLMIQLARECREETLHVTDLPYRLSSWALDEPENVGLWMDEAGELSAWAVMQTPFWSIDFVIRPEWENALITQILDWVDLRAGKMHATSYGLPAWYVNVFADQIGRRQVLERAGFADQSEAGEAAWTKVWMECSGGYVLPDFSPPAGFSLRSLAGEGEVETYVELHRAVFETKNMTSEWRLRTLNHPDYEPELDLVVAAPDGRLAAFCIGWLSHDAHGKLCGQIEPLGCHADFRKYALGRVALCETMHRLRQHGVNRIFVETDGYRNTAFRLYESVGFRVIRDVLVYRKDYNETAG